MQILKPKRRAKKRQGRSRKGEGSVYQRGGIGTFYYKIPDPSGSKPVTGSCDTEDYDRALLVKNRKLIELHDRIPKPAGVATIAEILRDYEKICETKKAWASLRAAISHLRESLGRIVADELQTADIDRYRAAAKEARRVSDSTVNRELGYLRAALRAEMKKTPARVTRIPHMETPSESNRVREGFIERDGYERILAELPESLKAIFVCGFHTGARSGELKSLRWEQVNFRQGLIEIRGTMTKTGEGRWLPIWGEMRECLQEQKRVRDAEFPQSPWVFFWRSGYSPKSIPGERLKDFRKAWGDACKRAGFRGLLFHDLRRSALRFADQDAGLSQSMTMLMSGHKTDSVFRRYNIRGGRDMAKVVSALDSALAKLKASRKGAKSENKLPRKLHGAAKTSKNIG